MILFVFTSSFAINADYKAFDIETIKLTKKDVPSGFIFGKVPKFARRVLKNNPWMLDKSAIKKLTRRIYPGGNYTKISKIHMTIMANRKNPYGDDIVCYVILFRNSRVARKEINKIKSYANYNKDRVIIIVKKNMVIYLHIDSNDHYNQLEDLAKNMKERLKRI